MQTISVDDHVMETPAIWSDRLPRDVRHLGPRLERVRGVSRFEQGRPLFQLDPEGRWCDVWRYEETTTVPIMRSVAQVGFDRSEEGYYPVTLDEIRRGCYERDARLSDMDADGIQASLCFPNTFIRFAGQLFLEGRNRGLGLACLKAYNDWIIEEWSAKSQNRLIPLCIVPLWDPNEAADEVRRNAARGCHAAAFTEFPHYLGLPTVYEDHWEPLLMACEETTTTLCLHVGSGSKLASTAPGAPERSMGVVTFVNPAIALTDWILSGKLARHPGLRLMFAECQIGWLPYLLERMDSVWTTHWAAGWIDGKTAKEVLPEPPSSYFRRQVLCSFFNDPHGIASIERANLANNVAFEVDYPHQDSTWPDSHLVAREVEEVLPRSIATRVLRGNAIDFFRLEMPD